MSAPNSRQSDPRNTHIASFSLETPVLVAWLGCPWRGGRVVDLRGRGVSHRRRPSRRRRRRRLGRPVAAHPGGLGLAVTAASSPSPSPAAGASASAPSCPSSWPSPCRRGRGGPRGRRPARSPSRTPAITTMHAADRGQAEVEDEAVADERQAERQHEGPVRRRRQVHAGAVALLGDLVAGGDAHDLAVLVLLVLAVPELVEVRHGRHSSKLWAGAGDGIIHSRLRASHGSGPGSTGLARCLRQLATMLQTKISIDTAMMNAPIGRRPCSRSRSP